MVSTKEMPFQNEMGLATTTLLAWVTNESPCQGMLLFKDALVIISKSSRILLELRGLWTTLFERLDVLITIGMGMAQLLDDTSTTHMLLIHGSKVPVLNPFFEAFKESKGVATLFDG